MFTTRTVIAVVVAGFAGTVANSIIVAGLTPLNVLPLIFSFGREAVAIIVALLLPILFAIQGREAAIASGFILLTLIPSILAKTVFALDAGWLFVIAVNAVYAAAAVAVYLVVLKLWRERA